MGYYVAIEKNKVDPKTKQKTNKVKTNKKE